MRPLEIQNIFLPGDSESKSSVFAYYDVRKDTKRAASLRIFLTIIVFLVLQVKIACCFNSVVIRLTGLCCLCLQWAVIILTRDVNGLIIHPIEMMVELVQEISKNPLAVEYRMPSTEDGFEEGLETTMLMQTINKIGGLMRVCFGQAGSNVIARNLISSTQKLNIMGPGTQINAIFGFCDIRQFTNTTECLQEDVMLFVNRIAFILHGICAQNAGSANKNIGDAFLLTWLIDNLRPGEVTRRADQALITYCKTLVQIKKSHNYICDFSVQATIRLRAKYPNYQVNMGCGLHVGWAIEGAIGSRRKIDASYLSPHVNMAEYLEFSTKRYGVPLLLSESFVNILSHSAKKYCRMVDRVRRKPTEQPFSIYTYDTDLTIDYNDFRARNKYLNTQKSAKVVRINYNPDLSNRSEKPPRQKSHVLNTFRRSLIGISNPVRIYSAVSGKTSVDENMSTSVKAAVKNTEEISSSQKTGRNSILEYIGDAVQIFNNTKSAVPVETSVNFPRVRIESKASDEETNSKVGQPSQSFAGSSLNSHANSSVQDEFPFLRAGSDSGSFVNRSFCSQESNGMSSIGHEHSDFIRRPTGGVSNVVPFKTPVLEAIYSCEIVDSPVVSGIDRSPLAQFSKSKLHSQASSPVEIAASFPHKQRYSSADKNDYTNYSKVDNFGGKDVADCHVISFDGYDEDDEKDSYDAPREVNMRGHRGSVHGVIGEYALLAIDEPPNPASNANDSRGRKASMQSNGSTKSRGKRTSVTSAISGAVLPFLSTSPGHSVKSDSGKFSGLKVYPKSTASHNHSHNNAHKKRHAEKSNATRQHHHLLTRQISARGEDHIGNPQKLMKTENDSTGLSAAKRSSIMSNASNHVRFSILSNVSAVSGSYNLLRHGIQDPDHRCAPDLKMPPYTPTIWEEDDELRILRHKFTPQFKSCWREAMAAYLVGEWYQAKLLFTTNMKDDAVAIYLISFIDSYNGEAPESWAGWRAEYDVNVKTPSI